MDRKVLWPPVVQVPAVITRTAWRTGAGGHYKDCMTCRCRRTSLRGLHGLQVPATNDASSGDDAGSGARFKHAAADDASSGARCKQWRTMQAAAQYRGGAAALLIAYKTTHIINIETSKYQWAHHLYCFNAVVQIKEFIILTVHIDVYPPGNTKCAFYIQTHFYVLFVKQMLNIVKIPFNIRHLVVLI